MALQLVDIDHRYGRRPSLRSVRMTVERGDCYGFIGHNGAGKTTTLRIALGLDRPTAGAVLIDGFAIRDYPLEARARLGGMIEVTGFYPWASGRINLIELARLQGIDRRQSIREADRWLDVVGLGERGHHDVRTYSQGMRQRLGLAQALLGTPDFVLLDEPQNGLDPEGIAELRDVLRRLTRDEGMTVLLSSHQLHELTGLCNRIGVLRQGQLLLEAATDELLATTRGRYELATDDSARTDAVLRKVGARRAEQPDGVRDLIELGAVSPRDLVRELVQAGVGVDRVVPRPTTLEEVYLKLAADPNPSSIDDRIGDPPTTSAPETRVAPRLPSLRMARYEIRRHARRWSSALLVAIPGFLAWQRIASLAEDYASNLAGVQAGKPFSTSTVTSFEALGRGIVAATPALAVILAAVASQSISGELSLGTLRNVLLRPLRRVHVVLGKALSLLTMVLVAYATTAVVAFVSATAYFDFADRYEIFKDSEPQLWIEAIDVWPLVTDAVCAPLLPLFAYAAVGFLIGAVVERSIWALSISLFTVVALDLGRSIVDRLGRYESVRALELESWLPSAHLPSPLGDTSFFRYYLDVAIGSAEAVFPYESTAVLVPATWAIAAFALGGIAVARRRVS